MAEEKIARTYLTLGENNELSQQYNIHQINPR